VLEFEHCDRRGKEVNPTMRRFSAWLVMGTFLLSLAVPALAQQTPAPSSAPAAPSSAPAAKTPAPAKADTKKVATKTATGTVKSAAPDNLVVMAGKDKKEWTFALDKDTKITKGGKAAKVEDVTADDSATVTYVEQDGKMHAKTVSVKAKAAAAAKPKS
jgi:hypothetical protein